ncbi:hypothetical protein, variant [Blastomyces dermatitidis ER-3]|uniref:DUF28 domain-containing protein n=1 Tax=Ajellomyces dermatitidis (strain ER-3 / ATCC MYA-2586) TaxID=559297 RepID=A0ABX2VY65_AJEDR|nr:hypothetical protein, variant [Blastomyces dermatitidis ER-3]OAT02081.1 hypothetical protein, variant [Blastomyces dermatitidis ER-3]
MASTFRLRLLGGPRSLRPWVCKHCRALSSSAIVQAGHNRWSTIRHDKGKNDAAKSKERILYARDIINASKLFGPDPASNPRLALVISKAKRSGMSKSTIEAAIARGQGISPTGAPLESVTIEALLPSSVAVVIEFTPTSYLFEKKGRIVFEKVEGLNVDDHLEHAIDAGAIDVDTDDQGRLRVFAEYADTKAVGDKLSALTGLKIETADIIWDPNKDTVVELQSREDADKIEEILSAIREEPTVQDIYTNSTTL